MRDYLTSMKQSTHLTDNYILNALPDEDFKRMLPDLEKVNFTLGELLSQPGDPVDYIYFPNDSMISEITTTADGETAEAGVIGKEGLVGIDPLLGTNRTFNQRLVQLSGSAIRMSVSAALNEFKRGDAFQSLTLQYVRLMMAQISQTALCNRLHSVEQRLARWLLLCHDRNSSDELKLTQEFLGVMLGTYRSTVTTAAITLQNYGLIRYVRGRITILDHEGLEDLACDCYRTVKDEYDCVQK